MGNPETLKRVYLSIGTNLGDRLENVRRALLLIRELPSVIEKVSPLYETEPLGFESKNFFYNLVIKIRTFLSAPALFLRLKWIELCLGRRPSEKVTDRVIDIDIVLYEDLVLETELLSIPHPRAWERAFVVLPLLDLEEQILDPKSGLSLEEIFKENGKIFADQSVKNLKICPLL